MSDPTTGEIRSYINRQAISHSRVRSLLDSAWQMFGHYGKYFWIMVVCVFGIPLGALIFAPVKRHWWSILLVGAAINVGVWINRYLLVVPARLENHTPFSSTYELILVAGLFAGFLLVFLLLFKVFPMISTWEMRDAAGEEGPAY